MKIRKKVLCSVHAPSQKGTKFYKYTIDDVIDIFSSEDSNIWVYTAFVERGWDAIDFNNNLYGSRIIKNVLYLCVSDGYGIRVGESTFDPDSILDDLDLSEIDEYIKDGDGDVARKYITEYELHKPDFDKWADSVLDSGVKFSKMVDDYLEFK